MSTVIGVLADILQYTAIPLVVGVSSYIAGFETCVLTNHRHHRVGVAVMARRTSPDPPDPEAVAAIDDKLRNLPPRRRIGGLDLQVVGYLLGALALVVAGFTAYQGQSQQRALLSCLNTYANQSADALDTRVKAGNQRSAAIIHAFSVVSEAFDGQADRGAVQHAIDQAIAADARLNRQQEKHPLPDPPREVCPQ